MSEMPVEQRVKAILVKLLGVKDADVSAEKSITDDLGADSLDVVELMMEMEEEFGIRIPEEQAEKIRTVGDAVAFISANQVATPSQAG